MDILLGNMIWDKASAAFLKQTFTNQCEILGASDEMTEWWKINWGLGENTGS